MIPLAIRLLALANIAAPQIFAPRTKE